MSIHPIVAAVHALLAADRTTCDRAALAERASLAARVRSWLDAVDIEIAADASRLGEPTPELMTAGGRRKSREAEAVVERAAVCSDMPSLHDALAAGSMSAGHVDAVARAADRLQPEERAELVELAPSLVASAASKSVEAFERETRRLAELLSRNGGISRHERLRRQRSLRRWVDKAGLHHTHVTLDPEADAKFSAALDAAVASERSKGEDPDEERTFEQLKADAFVSLATGARTGERRHPEVLVLVDHDTLATGLHERTVCETNDGCPLPVETVRRMCCDADIIPIVLNGHGAALDAGLSRRVATAQQRRALRAMHRTCGFPGCTVRFGDCEIHYVLEWIKQRGPTNSANLLPLCSRHHHLVHEGRWSLTLHPDRTIILRRPDASIHTNATTVDVAPDGLRPELTDFQRVMGEAVDTVIIRARRSA